MKVTLFDIDADFQAGDTRRIDLMAQDFIGGVEFKLSAVMAGYDLPYFLQTPSPLCPGSATQSQGELRTKRSQSVQLVQLR